MEGTDYSLSIVSIKTINKLKSSKEITLVDARIYRIFGEIIFSCYYAAIAKLDYTINYFGINKNIMLKVVP